MKSPEMEKFLNRMSIDFFGRTRKNGTCVSCGVDVNIDTDFRDALSRKEYRISFMCQACQDKIFHGFDTGEE